jgi:hypothetical protein
MFGGGGEACSLELSITLFGRIYAFFVGKTWLIGNLTSPV